jgi:DNA-binding NarL/FixJ family response regulator
MSYRVTAISLPKEKGREAMPKTASARTVIACAPGIREQSLRSTLNCLPAVDVVGSAPGCLSALQMVREKVPALLVVDGNLPAQEVRILLQKVREDRLRTRSLVLTVDGNQSRRSLSAGADAVFRRDGPVQLLEAIISDLNHSGEDG